MAQIARERDQALREVDELREELAVALGNPCAQCQAETNDLRQAINAYLDLDGSRGQYHALELAAARERLQDLLNHE